MRSVPLTLLFATLVPVNAPALAQVAPTTPPTQAPLAGPRADIEDAEIRQFASAFGEIRQLRRKWAVQVEQAEKQGAPEQAQQMEEAAYAEMVDAVVTQGLSVRRYNQIAAVAQNDPELQERIATHLRQP